MPRKGHTQKRDVLADPMYNSKVVTKLKMCIRDRPYSVQFHNFICE